MAVIVLVQVCMPCDDDTIATKTDKFQTSVINSTSHQNHDNKPDNCSEFCQCSCCAGFSICYSFPDVAIPVNPGGVEFTSYLQLNVIEISFPIWQPPQLAA